MKRFTIYDDEVKSALDLIKKLGNTTNEVIDNFDNKTDKKGNHEGSWQGINKPTISEQGMRAIVEKLNEETIPGIENKTNEIETYKTLKNNDLQKAINENTTILLTNDLYEITETIKLSDFKTIKGIEGKTKIYFKGDIDCFDLTGVQNCKIQDVEILVDKSNTKTVFKGIGQGRYCYSNTFKNISINTFEKSIGKYTGILLKADTSGVFKNQFINISINNCFYGVYLGSGAKWVNMNTFDKISIIGYINGICFDATGDILNNTFIRPMLEDTTNINADNVETDRVALKLEGRWNDIISPLIFNDGYGGVHYTLQLTKKSLMNSIIGGHLEGRVLGDEFLTFNNIDTGLVDRDNFTTATNQMVKSNYGKVRKVNILKNPKLKIGEGTIIENWTVDNLTPIQIIDSDSTEGYVTFLSNPTVATNSRFFQAIENYEQYQGKSILFQIKIKAKNIPSSSLILSIIDGANIQQWTVPQRYYNNEEYTIISYVYTPTFSNGDVRFQLQINAIGENIGLYVDYFRAIPIKSIGENNTILNGIALHDENIIDIN